VRWRSCRLLTGAAAGGGAMKRLLPLLLAGVVALPTNAGAVATGAARPKATHGDDGLLPPPPPPLPNGCECADFCAGRCSYNTSVSQPGSALNLTVMRETPLGVYTLGNKDTADSAGDLAFGIRTLFYSYLCRHDPTYRGCFLNTENVYLRADLEVSSAYGPYQSCNPPKNESAHSQFHCTPQAWSCSHELTAPCPRVAKTIGYEDVAKKHANGLLPLNPVGGFNRTIDRTTQWKVHVAVITGGSWYSIPAEGECNGTDTPTTPSGCSWRLRTAPRIFNATCVNDRLRAAIEAYAASSAGGGCFQQRCTVSERTDFGSDCYTECLFDVILGNETAAPPMTKQQLMAPWEAAFAPGTGGCPTITPQLTSH